MERLQELERERNLAIKYKELRERLQVLEASLAHKKYEMEKRKFEEMEKNIEEMEKEVEQIEGEIKKLDKQMEEKEKRKEEITKTILVRSKGSELREEIESIKSKILRDRDRIEADKREIERLKKLIERLSSLGERTILLKKGVKAILDLKKKGVFGTVADLIKIPKQYRIAIEVAAGQRLQDLVVDKTETAIECINYLKKNKIGRATFLPLDRIKAREVNPKIRLLLKKPGVIGLASKLIKFDKKFTPVIEHVFGDTIIVENLGVARSLGNVRARIVTLEGDLIEKSGMIVGGYYEKVEISGGVEDEIEEYEQAKKDLEEEIVFLNIEIEELEKKLKELEKSKEEELGEFSELEGERSKIEKELEELREKRKELFEKRLVLQNKLNRLKINAAKKEAELNNLKIEVEKYKGIEIIDEKPKVLEFEIQQTISTLNSLGLVNLKAIEEYEEFKGEFDELKKKYDKIRKEKEAIEDMIRNIDEKRKEVFYECLRAINKNFKEIFKEIANGEASIELEDPLDIESGLLIQANPSGKSLVNIDAMSGGEKSLTALAFLFAIQKYKPAPFYVLDEIDAFLDKVNTKRIADLIKRLSKKEQFIVITHNDYTIKQGDRVYGVTMENGESKILGLELPKGGMNVAAN
ncbi:MAG TPA: hypothetical protein ENG34_00915 [Candidatus Aenigmarchaeota archaeon]|nr:hypothetical protein [Candidatus Aenigmarchaeota archaeon]